MTSHRTGIRFGDEEMKLEEIFTCPPSAYRGKPFWAWNGRLCEEELRRQIRVFKKMGLGGAFLHSRVGLATEYLSNEWFNLVKACVDESRKNDMEAWLYDEDRWPSGAAGGLVTKDPRYQRRVLRLRIEEPGSFEADGTELGIFLASIEGDCARDVRSVDPENPGQAKRNEKILSFKVVRDDPSPWYNGQTYLDTMSKGAVDKFIEVTHKAYADSMGEEFGSIVPGIFTDEPNYGTYNLRENSGHAPWTDGLPSTFKERYGYDLLPHLSHLFLKIEGEDFSKVRYHYFDCLTYLFTHSFAEPIGKWCGENNMLFTGHVLSEETLTSQTSVVGSAMRFYEFMQAPGIDILRGEGLTREGGMAPELATAKQCSSVKHQFGRKWMLSEIYGCTGWHFNFAEHKAVGDWQAALGVNLRCQHLSWYTMLGQAKRDYPASISFQSSWWRDYSVVEDYFARVGVLMTQGEPIRDVAVIHPIESAWGIFCGHLNDSDSIRDLSANFEAVQEILLQEHYDFDYVDEEMLSRHGKVENGELILAKASYRAVVVPPTLTLRSSTLDLLSSLMESGVPVIFITPVADRVDAEESDGAKELSARATKVALDREAIGEALGSLGNIRRVSIQRYTGGEFPDSLYMLRHDQQTGRYLVFVCHTKQDSSTGPLVIRMPCAGQVQEWDLISGQIYLADSEKEGNSVLIHTEMPGVGSRAYVVDPNPKEGPKPRPKWSEVRKELIQLETWPILRDEPNAFPLDVGEYSVEEGVWNGPLEVLKMDASVRDVAGLPHRGGSMVQPWAQVAPPEAKTVNLAVRFHFNVEWMPHGPCHLVTEEPEKYEITLNGKALEPDQDEGWWIDTSMKRIRVPPSYLKYGENEILLRTEYGPKHGLESLYFTGEFGTRWENRRPVITKLPVSLELGDWTEAGFPCYSGSVTYMAEIDPKISQEESIFLKLPKWEGVLTKIRINGKSVGNIAWPPYEVEISNALGQGRNRLEIEVVSSRRNLLGPLHLTEKYPYWTGPGQFETSGAEWTDDYVKVPYGLMESPVLSVRKLVEEGK